MERRFQKLFLFIIFIVFWGCSIISRQMFCVFAARDQVIDTATIESQIPFSFRYGGAGSIDYCLNQLTGWMPTSGTYLTGLAVPSGGTNETQWFLMVEIRNGSTIGHGYACYNAKTIGINRRRLVETPYVNVVTLKSYNTMGDADVRWACHREGDPITGVDRYLVCSNLDLTNYDSIGNPGGNSAAGVYLIWRASSLPSSPFEWIRYNEYYDQESIACGCYISYGEWFYNPW